MSAEVENPPAPNWLKKLEEQRERRLKARLGHEAGAGAKCQKCGDKCPGLDLHFWRKICKVCKCGKEDHDIVDDDIYGFVQFQLLGSKPKPVKGIFLKGLKDEVTLDWTPRGASTDVRSYLDELPADMLPVQGSEGARIRKQRLQKQMPPHDIDASLCHQLTEDEVKELEEYVSHIRKNCVGQGKIIRLSLMKGNKINAVNPQYLSQMPPSQVASSQTVYLQSSDMSNNLANMSLHDKTNPSVVQNYAQQNLNPVIDNQIPVLGKTTDLNYFPQQNIQNVVHPLTTSNVERHQEQYEIENYANYAPNYINPVEQHQLPVQVGQPKDIKYPQYDGKQIHNANVDKISGKPLPNYNPNYVNTIEANQIPKNVKYPPINTATHPLLQKNTNYLNQTNENALPNFATTKDKVNYSTLNNVKGNLQEYNPNFVNPKENLLLPSQIAQIKDIKYLDPINANQPYETGVPNVDPNTQKIGANDSKYPGAQNLDPNQIFGAKITTKDPKYLAGVQNLDQNQLFAAKIGVNDPKYLAGSQNLEPNNPLYSGKIGINDPNHPNQLYNTKIGANDPKYLVGSQNLDPNNPLYSGKIGINDPNHPNQLYNAQIGANDPNYLAGTQNLDPNNPLYSSKIGRNDPNQLYNAQIGANDPNYLAGTQNLDPNNPLYSGKIGRNDPNQLYNSQIGANDPNYLAGAQNLDPNNSNQVFGQNLDPINANHLDNYGCQADKLGFKPGIPILEAQNAINPFETLQNLQSVGYIRDIDYPTENNTNIVPNPEGVLEDINIPKCHNCKEDFQDGSVAISVERTPHLWHSKCFICHTCNQPLADLVYFYHKETDQIHCGRDYAILKGIPRCQACDELIFVREYCLAEDNTFHVKHFCCFECDDPLAGKQYILENNQPVCIPCYENLKAEQCNYCNAKIKPDEQGVCLQNLHWHATDNCFVCKKCKKALLGQKMLLRNQNLFCSDVCYKSF